MADTSIQRYMNHPIVPLDVYPVGTVIKSMEINGNALLSSIFVKSAGAGSVKVNYYQTTSGTFPEHGERLDLTSHPLKSSANDGETSQIVVTRIHNKPVLEFVVTDAPVEFGVYVKVVDELASDIDSALVLDDQTTDLDSDKGIPIACYNETTGKWELIRCPFPVTLAANPGVFREGTVTTNSTSNPNALDSFAVPAGKTYRVNQVVVSTFVDGVFTLTAGGSIIAKGRTSLTSVNSSFKFIPNRPITAGTTVALSFDQIYQTTGDCTVDWHIQMDEEDT